jgi:hypothetical protein
MPNTAHATFFFLLLPAVHRLFFANRCLIKLFFVASFKIPSHVEINKKCTAQYIYEMFAVFMLIIEKNLSKDSSLKVIANDLKG